MIKGLDYSWARPGGATIKAAGYQFVVRYIPYPGNGGKGLEHAELNDLRKHGIDIAMVYESYANRALQGFSAGVADAKQSIAQLNRLGFPKIPVYFAVDFDAAEHQQDEIDAYLKGAASVIGADRVGVYAGYWVIKRCYENKTAKYLWQTYAWSGGNVHPKIHLYQYLNGQNLNGAVDYNRAYQANFGQWAADGAKPAPQPSAPSGNTYTVVSGDTLSGIGRKTGADWHRIADLNNIVAPYTIYPGQVLRLTGSVTDPAPQPKPGRKTYTVKKGDTLSGIGAKTGTVWQDIARLNGIEHPYTIYPNQVLVLPGSGGSAPKASSKTYKVKSGDYLSKIASQVGTTWQKLYALNKKTIGPDPNVIKAGQVLKLP